jgi:hypothetical protein
MALRKENWEITLMCNKPLAIVFYNFRAADENKTSS